MGRLPSSTTLNRRPLPARFSILSLVAYDALNSPARESRFSESHPVSGSELLDLDVFGSREGTIRDVSLAGFSRPFVVGAAAANVMPVQSASRVPI